MTYLYLCRHFYSATNIPITLTKNGVAVYSSYNDIVSSTPNYIREMFPLEQNPCFCGDIPDTIFGRVHIEGSDYDLFLGPVFSIPMDTDHLYQIKKHLSMSQETSETFLDFLRSIPLLTQHQFAHYLAFAEIFPTPFLAASTSKAAIMICFWDLSSAYPWTQITYIKSRSTYRCHKKHLKHSWTFCALFRC